MQNICLLHYDLIEMQSACWGSIDWSYMTGNLYLWANYREEPSVISLPFVHDYTWLSEFIVWISKYLILTKTLKKHSYFLLQNPWKVLLSVWGSGDRAEKTEGFGPRPGVSVHWPRIHWPRLWRPKSAIAIFFYQEIWAIQCVRFVA